MLRSAQLKPFRRTQTKWNKVKAKAILGDIEFKAKAILGDVMLHNSNFLSIKKGRKAIAFPAFSLYYHLLCLRFYKSLYLLVNALAV